MLSRAYLGRETEPHRSPSSRHLSGLQTVWDIDFQECAPSVVVSGDDPFAVQRDEDREIRMIYYVVFVMALVWSVMSIAGIFAAIVDHRPYSFMVVFLMAATAVVLFSYAGVLR